MIKQERETGKGKVRVIVRRKIGRDLSQTCAKMEKLAELTKRTSVFEDRNEVENLTRIIKEVPLGSESVIEKV